MKRGVGVQWYHGWNIVAVCVLGQIFAQGMAINCFSLFLGGWSREFSTPISVLSLGVSIFALASCVTTPIAGWAADKFTARKVFGLGFFLLVAMYGCFGLVTAAWQILVLYGTMVAVAIPLGGLATCQALVSRWFVRRRGLAMGITATGVVLAGVLFPPLVTALMPVLGWRGVWWAFGAAAALVAVLIILPVVRNRPGPNDSTAYVGPETAARSAPTLTYREVLTRPNFWIVAVTFTLVYCCYVAILFNLAPMVTSRGDSRQTAGLLLSLMSLAALISKVVLGLISDRFGNRIAFLALAAAAVGGVVLLLVAPGSLVCLASGLVLIGIASGIWAPVASAVAAEFGSSNFGRPFGVMSVCSPAASLSGAIFARMKEVTGSYNLGLTCLIGCGLVAGAVIFFLKEKGAQGQAIPVLDMA